MERFGASGEKGDGEVAVGGGGEDAGYAGALGGGLEMFMWRAEMGERLGDTVCGPAPMRMARPFGAIERVEAKKSNETAAVQSTEEAKFDKCKRMFSVDQILNRQIVEYSPSKLRH